MKKLSLLKKLRASMEKNGITARDISDNSGVPYNTCRLVCGGFAGSESTISKLLLASKKKKKTKQ